jgi:hypothetical protein
MPVRAYVLVLSGSGQFRRSKVIKKLTEEELLEQCTVRAREREARRGSPDEGMRRTRRDVRRDGT